MQRERLLARLADEHAGGVGRGDLAHVRLVQLGQAHKLDGLAGARHDLLDLLVQGRAGGHHEAVGHRRGGGGAAVDGAVDQHLLGAVGEHRVAHLAHVGGGAGARHLDRAARQQARDQHAPERGAHPGLADDLVGDRTGAQQRVGGGDEAAGAQLHAGLLDADVDHVALLAVAPDGGDADAAAARLQLAQQRGERFGLAGVLRQARRGRDGARAR